MQPSWSLRQQAREHSTRLGSGPAQASAAGSARTAMRREVLQKGGELQRVHWERGEESECGKLRAFRSFRQMLVFVWKLCVNMLLSALVLVYGTPSQ